MLVTNRMGVSMTRSRIIWLVGLALALSLLLVPGASADDVSTQGWAGAADSTIADYVQSPYTPQQWGGDGASIADLYNLPAYGYNVPEVDSVETALETAGETAEVFPNPFAVVASVAISTVGTYLAYKSQGLWFHWLSSQWGDAVSGQTNGCTAASTDLTSNCELWRIKAGTTLCIGYTGSAQSVVTWTAPSDGLLLAGDTSNLYTSSWSGPCYGYNWNPVALLSNNTTAIAAVNSSAGSGFETDTGRWDTPGVDFMIWFQPISGTWAGGAHPAGFQNDDIEPYSTQQIPTGDLGRYVGTPTVAQIANALRQQLTDPSDTCGGSACPWGSNGGSPSVDQTHRNSWNLSCVITGTCASTSLAPTFTMPNCYGMTVDGCDVAMQQLGFTGTLVPGTAADADYTLPAGDVVSTTPTAGAAVSTVASTIADASENPQACETLQVDNPHWSNGTGPAGSMLSYVHIQCTYTGEASFNANVYRCSSDPGVNGVNLATADCIEVATTTMTAAVAADSEKIVYSPWVDSPGTDPPVPWESGYWITTAVTTSPGVTNGPPQWSQGGWQPPSP